MLLNRLVRHLLLLLHHIHPPPLPLPLPRPLPLPSLRSRSRLVYPGMPQNGFVFMNLAKSGSLGIAKQPESTWTAYFQVAWAWCSDLSAPSVTAMGYWGQARVTGHEATRGTEQDRQIGTFALSRARKLAKQPESTWTAYFQVAWAWCSDLSAPSVTAMGYWGQARVTGHEATRGTE
eukprot:COSAG06_NODE_7577_length_2452_cov_2.529312_2_plen_176_part_01